jgi:tRNA(Ile)-lysidine synthase
MLCDNLLVEACRNYVLCFLWYHGLFEWQGAEIRRYQDKLYLMEPLTRHDNTQILSWDGCQSLAIPGLNIQIGRDDFPQEKGAVTVRFRQGGERIQIPGRGTISLKNLMQERAVPPWLRSRLPLIYVGDNLFKIIGLE